MRQFSHFTSDLAILCALALVAFLLPDSLGFLSYFAVLGMALVGHPLLVVKALTLQFFLAFFNEKLFGTTQSYGLHLIIPLAVIVRYFIDGGFRVPAKVRRDALLFFSLVAVFIVFEFFASEFPFISIIKVLSFASFVVAVNWASVLAWRNDSRLMVKWYLTVVGFVVVASVPVLATPYARVVNETGFQGILNHPNAFGMVVGVGLAYLLSRCLLMRRPIPLLLWVSAVGLALIVLSESRGGMLTLILSLVCFSGIQAWGRNTLVKGRIMWLLPIGLGCAILLSVGGGGIAGISSFVSKSGRQESGNLAEAFDASRGRAIDTHLELFREKPWTGHGFQVVDSTSATGMVQEDKIIYEPIFGKVPISAPVESGFLYTSLLAENGVIGVIILGAILMIFVVPVFRMGLNGSEGVIPFAVMFANVSESAFFATSGLGGFLWLMMGLAYARVRIQPATVGVHSRRLSVRGNNFARKKRRSLIDRRRPL